MLLGEREGKNSRSVEGGGLKGFVTHGRLGASVNILIISQLQLVFCLPYLPARPILNHIHEKNPT